MKSSPAFSQARRTARRGSTGEHSEGANSTPTDIAIAEKAAEAVAAPEVELVKPRAKRAQD